MFNRFPHGISNLHPPRDFVFQQCATQFNFQTQQTPTNFVPRMVFGDMTNTINHIQSAASVRQHEQDLRENELKDWMALTSAIAEKTCRIAEQVAYYKSNMHHELLNQHQGFCDITTLRLLAQQQGYAVHDIGFGEGLRIRPIQTSPFELRVTPEMTCVLFRINGVVDAAGQASSGKRALPSITNQHDAQEILKLFQLNQVNQCPGFPRYSRKGNDKFEVARKDISEYITNKEGTVYYCRAKCDILNKRSAEIHEDQKDTVCKACLRLADQWRKSDDRQRKAGGTPPSKHTPDKYLTPSQLKDKKKKNASLITKLQRQLRKYKLKETAAGRTVVLNQNDHSMYEQMYLSCVVGDKKQQMQEFLDNPNNKCEHMKEFFQEQLVLSEKVTRNSKLKNGHRWGTHTLRVMLAVYCASSSAYNELAKSGTLLLPHKRTLRRYISANKSNPGIVQEDAFKWRTSYNMFMKSKATSTASVRPKSKPQTPVADVVPAAALVTNSMVHFSMFTEDPDYVKCHPRWDCVMEIASQERERAKNLECRRAKDCFTEKATNLTSRDKQNVYYAKLMGTEVAVATMRFAAFEGPTIDYEKLATAEYMKWGGTIFNQGYLSHDAVYSTDDVRLKNIR